MAQPIIGTNAIPKFVKIFKVFYLVSGIIGIIGFLSNIILYIVLNRLNPVATLVSVIGAIVSLGIYAGLRRREPWIPWVIVIVTLLTLLYSLYVNAAIPGRDKFFIILRALLWVWDVFTIYFFSRVDVRQHFKTRGLTLLGG